MFAALYNEEKTPIKSRSKYNEPLQNIMNETHPMIDRIIVDEKPLLLTKISTIVDEKPMLLTQISSIQKMSKEMEIAYLLDKTPKRLYKVGDQKVTGARLTEFYYGIIWGLNCDYFKVSEARCGCNESLIWKLIPIHCSRCFGTPPTFYEFIHKIMKRNKYTS